MQFDIEKGVPVYSKVNIKDKQPPLCLHFRQLEKGDYRVCLSFRHEHPDDDTCDETEKKPKKMFVQQFNSAEYLYIALLSKNGCSLSMKISYPIILPKKSKDPLKDKIEAVVEAFIEGGKPPPQIYPLKIKPTEYVRGNYKNAKEWE